MNLKALKKGIVSLAGWSRKSVSGGHPNHARHNLVSPARRVALAAASLCLAVAAVAVGPAATAQPIDAQGWTKITPSPDSRIIYVSDSQGNDNNDGMTPQTPVKTIAKGFSLLRNGYPDWMLLKRGDTFTDQALNSSWNRSGRSLNEPMVFSSYGDSPNRPKILSPPSSPAIQAVNGTHNHLAFVGLHFEPHNRQPNQTPRAIRWLANTTNFLVEDCYMGGYRDNMAFQEYNGSVLKNVRIRRNVVVDSWSTKSHSQGLYVKDVQGLLIEENVFDHNGWHPTIDEAHATIYNHNMYLQYGGSTNVVVRGNVVARGSATGIQQRTGGLCEDNLLLRNPTNILFGHFQADWPSQAASGTVRNNVVFDAQDINGSPRGFGIWFQNVDGVDAYGNVVAHQINGSGNVRGISANYNYKNLTIRNNVVYNWNGGQAMRFLGDPVSGIHIKNNFVQQPNGSDLVRHDDEVSLNPFTYAANTYFSTKASPFSPGGSYSGWLSASGELGSSWSATSPLSSCDHGGKIESYMQCLGYTATMEAFIAEARKQSRHNWRPEFTAEAVNSFVRGAYGLPADGL